MRARTTPVIADVRIDMRSAAVALAFFAASSAASATALASAEIYKTR
jgi:hypothetical protein